MPCHLTKYLIQFTVISILLTACSGGGGGSDNGGKTSFTSFELIDPTPGADNNFGSFVVILGNGNIVVTEPNDDSNGTNSGAVHLYNPNTRTRLASFYGDDVEDQLGSHGVTVLANNNFVISSVWDDSDSIVDAGSVILVDGATGDQIGNTFYGDSMDDRLGHRFGDKEGITALANSNFVITSMFDDVNGIVDAGSVKLINGSTGLQIGATLSGDVANDGLGAGGIIALANNNFVVASLSDDENGFVDNGSVRLVDGSTGIQIGDPIVGEASGVQIGSKGITALNNHKFVMPSSHSVMLVDDSTGTQIGEPLLVNENNATFNPVNTTALPNNNYVVVTYYDYAGAGSVRLINGSTNAQIGSTLIGGNVDDHLGFSGITVLENSNFVIKTMTDNEGGIRNAGSARLVDGSTGIQIGDTFAGDVDGDNLGGGVTALPNNNFVIAAGNDDENGIVDAGSVRLVNGNTAIQIGSTLTGDLPGDRIGRNQPTVLANNNFVIASESVHRSGLNGVGAIMLVDGNTGSQIGSTVYGDAAGDQLGSDGVTALSNNTFVVASGYDNEGGNLDVGSIRVMDGSTGVQISIMTGSSPFDLTGAYVTEAENGEFYVIALPNYDKDGLSDSGLVKVILQ